MTPPPPLSRSEKKITWSLLARVFVESAKKAMWLLFVFAAIPYVVFALFLAGSWVRYRLDDADMTSADVDIMEARIEARLARENYGLVRHALWSDLFAQSFYAYGRANRYERAPTPEKLMGLVATLRRTYENIDRVQGVEMAKVGHTRAKGGIIYQGHRLRVLALLAKYSGDPALKEKLFMETDALASLLRDAPKHTEESYPGWAWWVDNVDAYAALAIADSLAEAPRYSRLVADWVSGIKTSLDPDGNMLAEAYGPYGETNQPRSPATAWMVPSLRTLDDAFAGKQLETLDDSFFSTFLGMPVMDEVPHGRTLVNPIGTGPVVFGKSSAGTMLAIAAYGSMGRDDRVRELERTVRAAFFYDRSSGRLCFGLSTLLESTFYWAESFSR